MCLVQYVIFFAVCRLNSNFHSHIWLVPATQDTVSFTLSFPLFNKERAGLKLRAFYMQ